MKYHNNQIAAPGDRFIVGHWGTCKIVSLDPSAHLATVRNICTGELFELDNLAAADLIERAPKYHTMEILTFGKTIITASSIDDIIGHLRGRFPTSHASRTIYSLTPPTFDQAEEIAALPDFDAFTAHINLI